MYVKLFGSILTSSVWSEDASIRIVWITLLALADKEGNVRCAPSALARVANVSADSANMALAKFMAPDIESGTPDHEGRRIIALDGGWHVLNYAKYRAMQDEEDRKAQWRESSARYREKNKAPKKRQQKSAPRQRKSGQAEAEAKADTEANTEAKAEGEKAASSSPDANPDFLKHCRLIVAAANLAITESYGEQPNPLRVSSTHSYKAVNEMLEAGVDPSFAADTIYEKIKRRKAEKMPGSVNYFTRAVVEEWGKAVERKEAVAYVPGSAPRPMSKRLSQLEFTAIKEAKRGDVEWIAFCKENLIDWESAV